MNQHILVHEIIKLATSEYPNESVWKQSIARMLDSIYHMTLKTSSLNRVVT